MKFRNFVFILVMVTGGSIFAMDYTNEEHGIHFVLPDHWKVTDFEDLPAEKQQRLDNLYHPLKTLAICGVMDNEIQKLTQIIIQYRKFEKSTFDKTKKFMQSAYGKKMAITSAKINARDAVGREIKQYKIVETECDFIESDNRLYGIVRYESNDKQKATAMEVKIVTKNGVVTMCCFSRGPDVEEFVDIVDDIANSFEFDESSSDFQKTSRERSQEMGKKTMGLAYKLCGSFFGILIVIWILKKIFRW